MSKRESITRYTLIIKKLRRKPATFKEIFDTLALESELQEYNFIISKRTFQRDLDDIRSLYGIDIQFDFSRKVYFIDMELNSEFSERILEAFDTFNALNISERLAEIIHFEKRKPLGTENLYGLLHAIKNQLQIRFKYQKFWEEESSIRLVEPCALKEFRYRWYLMAFDPKDKLVKSFALDRLSELEISNKKNQYPHNFDIHKHYKYSFGIISPEEVKPEVVILSLDPFQGKYIKSLPLHSSQETLIDNEHECRIQLKLHITHDFFMEICSLGNKVKVIQPESLRQQIIVNAQEVLKLY